MSIESGMVFAALGAFTTGIMAMWLSIGVGGIVGIHCVLEFSETG